MGLYPSQEVSQATIERTDQFLQELGEQHPALRRLLLESRADIVRALHARQADQA